MPPFLLALPRLEAPAGLTLLLLLLLLAAALCVQAVLQLLFARKVTECGMPLLL
jgi:hypothetical protein